MYVIPIIKYECRDALDTCRFGVCYFFKMTQRPLDPRTSPICIYICMFIDCTIRVQNHTLNTYNLLEQNYQNHKNTRLSSKQRKNSLYKRKDGNLSKILSYTIQWNIYDWCLLFGHQYQAEAHADQDHVGTSYVCCSGRQDCHQKGKGLF